MIFSPGFCIMIKNRIDFPTERYPMKKLPKFHIGLRTIKTVIAVIISLLIIEGLGTTDSKMIFAMVGAMTAVGPTFMESLEASLAQIIGVVFGAICSVLLSALPLPDIVAIGTGIALVITLYNALQIRYSPGLPCFVLVLVCTTPDIQPFAYAVGRIWDTTIGLAIGMAINMLVFPYDNSQQIRTTAFSLDKTLLSFLEDYFDGDDILPDIRQMRRGIAALERQLKLFSNQKLLLHLSRQNRQLEAFQECERKAQALITHMEVLCSMEKPGRLSPENRALMASCGAEIQDQRPYEGITQEDTVTNYHVTQILDLRWELLAALDVC